MRQPIQTLRSVRKPLAQWARAALVGLALVLPSPTVGAEIVERPWLKVETPADTVDGEVGLFLGADFFERVPSASLAPPPDQAWDSRLAILVGCDGRARFGSGRLSRTHFIMSGKKAGAVVFVPGLKPAGRRAGSGISLGRPPVKGCVFH